MTNSKGGLFVHTNRIYLNHTTMKIKQLPLLALSMLTIACQIDNLELVEIPLSDNINEVPQLTVNELKLDKSPELLAMATQIEKVGDKLFIFDAKAPKKTMFVFNDEGKFINDFAFKGRGRGEVVMPFSFFVSNNAVNIIDISSYNLASYSLSGDNEFVSTKKIPFSGMSALETYDAQILWHIMIHPSNTENKFVDYCYLTTTNDSLTPKKGVLKQTVFLGTIKAGEIPVFKVGDEVHFTDRQCKSIYKLNNDVEEEIFRMKYGNFEFAPISLLNTINAGGNVSNSEWKPQYIRHYFLYETEDAIMATFVANRRKYIAMYYKENGDSFMVPLAQFSDKIGYKISHFTNTVDNSFVAVVENKDANPTLLFIK